MPDIFISYKKEERAVASELATRLTTAGYEVWWDDDLLAGERYEDEIAAVLDQCGAVVVLWSRQSVKSEWVKAEAEAARQQKKAFPIIIDDMPPTQMPLLYRGMHAARFEGWQGELSHEGYVELIGSIEDRVGKGRRPRLSANEAEAARQQKKAFPIIIDDMPPTQMPLLYRGMHAARFEGWHGELSHEGYVELIGSIEDRVGKGRGPRLSANEAEAKLAESASENVRTIVEATRPAARAARTPLQPIPPRRMLPLIIAGVAAIVVLAGVIGYWQYTQFSTVDAANSRCSAWASSDSLDWYTGAPRFDAAVLADCVLAAEKRPKDGDALGRLALLRLVQGQTVDDALTLANRGIENRGAVANYVMGLMYERGLRLQRDLPRAASYYKIASDLGSARAAGSLCLMGVDMRGQVSGVISSLSEAVDWCDKASVSNDVLGWLGKGYVLETGLAGGVVDPAGAAALYQRGAERGNDEAAVRLGILYHQGYGVAQDIPRAATLYQQAAAHDDPAGLRSLAISYELGEGLLKDELEAARLYEKASARRDVPALLLAGYGVEPTIIYTARIVRDIEMLAASPVALTAQRLRAQLYIRGLMRLPDVALAERELTSCADAGNQFCIVGLGNFYEFGDPSNKQPAKAAQYYEKASATGNLYGQYYWAYANDGGIGVARDVAKAVQFYRLAAAQGHLTSINRLSQLGQPLQ